MHYLLGAAIAGLVSLILARLSEGVALRLGLLDRAEGRKIHRGIRPIGGLALYLGFLVGALPFLTWSRTPLGILAGGSVVAGIGLLDDRFGLGPKTKLLGQVGGALIPILWGGVWISSVELGGLSFPLGSWGVPLTLLWVVGITNAVNLLDGLDGLAAGCAAISSGFIAWFAWQGGNTEALLLALVLLGAALGFLRYNSHPARLFLGNEGSYFLGFMVGVLALVSFQPDLGRIRELPILAPILLLGLPIADTLWAIIRRARARRPIFAPDQGHIHHRLLGRWGYPRALAILYGISLLLGLAALSCW